MGQVKEYSRSVVRFREEHVHRSDLDQNPHAVDDVVFPGDGLCGVALVIVVRM